MEDTMEDKGRLVAGKLPRAQLQRMLSKLTINDPRVLLGGRVGEDAALIDFGPTTLIAKTDPITFATDLIGWYAVQVNANDIAACGGIPKWLLATVLVPEGAHITEVEAIFDQLDQATQSLNVSLVGGHTEITYGLPRPVVCCSMLGEVPSGKAITTGGANPRDTILLTKGIAIEGTALLAREVAAQLTELDVPESTIESARGLLFNPGISVVNEARIAVEAGGVTSMHDPTEGGLASALAEIAEAAGTGLEVLFDNVHVLEETEVICKAIGADPWGLIASGSLLITTHPKNASKIIQLLQADGILVTEIGYVLPHDAGLSVTSANGKRPMPEFARDELARVLEVLNLPITG